MPACISIACRTMLGIVLAATFCLRTAAAADYPSRPIRAIINVTAGGTADVFARTLGEELHRRIGQPLIIDPRPGGGFIVAGRACAEAEPDGYTVCILSGETLVYNEFLFKKLPYDPRKDFAPITNFFFNTQALVVSAALGAELAALAKAKPGTLAYVAPSIPLGLFFDRFNRQNGTDLVRIPFKGGGEAVSGILSGTTPIASTCAAERSLGWRSTAPRARRSFLIFRPCASLATPTKSLANTSGSSLQQRHLHRSSSACTMPLWGS